MNNTVCLEKISRKDIKEARNALRKSLGFPVIVLLSSAISIALCTFFFSVFALFYGEFGSFVGLFATTAAVVVIALLIFLFVLKPILTLGVQVENSNDIPEEGLSQLGVVTQNFLSYAKHVSTIYVVVSAISLVGLVATYVIFPITAGQFWLGLLGVITAALGTPLATLQSVYWIGVPLLWRKMVNLFKGGENFIIVTGWIGLVLCIVFCYIIVVYYDLKIIVMSIRDVRKMIKLCKQN